MGIRKDGREPDDLRPVDVHPRLHRVRGGLGARGVRAHARAVHRLARGAGAAVAARQRPGAGSPPSTRCCRARRPSGSSARRPEGKQSGRTQEIQRLIGRSLRAVTDLELIAELQITVDCDVLQADGGTRTASICGGYVALHDACSRLLAAGTISAHPITDTCAAISVGIVDALAAPRPRLLRGRAGRGRHEHRDDGRGPVRRGAGDGRGHAVQPVASSTSSSGWPKAGSPRSSSCSGRCSPSRRAPR